MGGDGIAGVWEGQSILCILMDNGTGGYNYIQSKCREYTCQDVAYILQCGAK